MSGGEWRAVQDNKSGRIYYYNTKTKETTWNKPLELATAEERLAMVRKQEETTNFFRDMEANILRRISMAKEREEAARSSESKDEILYFTGGAGTDRTDDWDAYSRNRLRSRAGSQDFVGLLDSRTRVNSISGAPPRRIRTISTMDDEILMTLRQANGDDRRTTLYAQNKGLSNVLAEDKGYSDESINLAQVKATAAAVVGAAVAASCAKSIGGEANTGAKLTSASLSVAPAKSTEPPRRKLTRRNSTGTIYLSTTMASQDNSAMIHCVCAVIHAHLLAAAKENIFSQPQYDSFKDLAFIRPEHQFMDPVSLVPPLSQIKEFFTFIFSKSQLETDCIIMALIYVERLIKETRGRLYIRYDNWRSIVFACLVMASKVWDDLSMWNVDFSHVYPGFDLSRVNSLELSMLNALKYCIRVSAGEYAKYYFHLRSMIVRLGMIDSESNYIQPLDIAGARKLQLSTERYEKQSTAPRRRHHSVHESHKSSKSTRQLLSPRNQVGLEQLIHTEHINAAGEAPQNRTKRSVFNFDNTTEDGRKVSFSNVSQEK